MKYSAFIFGLGNPENEYGKTRHNAGLMVLNALAEKWGCQAFRHQSKFKAFLTEKNFPTSGTVLLAKSATYMNDSGWPVSALSRFYKLEPEAIYIIHDDLDLPLGAYKIQLAKGPKEHNGLLSIDNELGSTNFWHVRVGVDAREGDRSRNPKEYVLQPFPDAERQQLDTVIQELIERLTSLWQH